MSISYEQKAERYIFHLLLQSIIREHLASYSETSAGVEIEVPKEGVIKVSISRKYMLGHVDIQESPVYIAPSGEEQLIERMEQLLVLLGFRDEVFVREMMNSARNYAFALEAFEKRKQELPAPHPEEGTWEYILRRKKEDDTFSPLVFFEQWVINGHTTHPGTRTRLPMSPEDVKRYAPEWGATPGLVPLAVAEGKTNETAPFDTDMTESLLAAYPEVKKEFDHLPGKYRLIPLHPWQADHVLPEYYHWELERKTMIPLHSRIPTAALMSFRTMAPLHYGEPHIKTAMNVQMTSAVRTVSAASTKNGPIMANLLRNILEKDETMSETMTISGDLAGIHYTPDEEEDRSFFEKNIAAILRENPEASLTEEEVAMPAAALISESPVTGKLVAEEFAGEQTEEAAVSFIDSYARVLLPGVARLMSTYGIAMEAHLQNTVVVFKNRRPVRIDLRDCGGVRILSERLDLHFDEAPIDPSTNLLTDREEEMTAIFSHALFHNHLGEIIVSLARRLQIPEEGMWHAVHQVMEESFTSIRTEAARRDKARLLEQPSRMKSLVRMRLSDQFTEYEFVDAPNPFRKEEIRYDGPSNQVSGH